MIVTLGVVLTTYTPNNEQRRDEWRSEPTATRRLPASYPLTLSCMVLMCCAMVASVPMPFLSINVIKSTSWKQQKKSDRARNEGQCGTKAVRAKLILSVC